MLDEGDDDIVFRPLQEVYHVSSFVTPSLFFHVSDNSYRPIFFSGNSVYCE